MRVHIIRKIIVDGEDCGVFYLDKYKNEYYWRWHSDIFYLKNVKLLELDDNRDRFAYYEGGRDTARHCTLFKFEEEDLDGY